MGKAPAAEIWGWCRLFPDDIVQNPKIFLHEGHADAGVNVARARNPDCPGGFENPAAGANPLTVEFVIEFDAPAAIPLALIDLDHLARDAGDSVIGQVVGGIGPNAINGIWWK